MVFRKARVVVFCDGDFWHGRNLAEREAKLLRGHNAQYWIAKIRGNVARDRRIDCQLNASGWTVLRFWEGDIAGATEKIATVVVETVRARLGKK